MSSFNIPSEDKCSLTNDPIDFNSLLNSVKSEKVGAISTFLGTTRDFFEGLRHDLTELLYHTALFRKSDKVVTELYYEAYEEMALEHLQLICTNLRKRWSLQRIAIQHRLGSCPIGEISVAIAISSVHRRDSLEAVQAAIDELKASVPIWKKEFYADNQPSWKKNVEFAPKFI